MNFSFFCLMYIMSFYVAISGDDWFLVWLGLEINMMMFIVIIYDTYNMINIESCLKYFFIQSVGSGMFLLTFYFMEDFFDFFSVLILSYSLGSGPFYFWFPSMCEGISWLSCYLLMTLQKVIPLMVMMIFSSLVIYIIIFLSLLFGVSGSFNQVSLSKLMGYSSIFHLGLMFMCDVYGSYLWLCYLLMYMLMIFPVFFYFNKVSCNNMCLIMSWDVKLMMVLCVLSMSGVPPFLGFFIKWYAFIMVMKFSLLLGILLVFSSVVMFYVYMRIIYDGLIVVMDYLNYKEFYMNDLYLTLDVMSILGMVFGLILGIYMVSCNSSMGSVNFQG